MKKLLFILSLLFMIYGCGNNDPAIKVIYKQDLSSWGTIVNIRGCDYIKSGVHGGAVYTHCGDCPNPIHYTQNK